MLSASELKQMNEVAPFRSSRLFEEFLPSGYRLTTLDSVTEVAKVVELKTILGTLITLYDDFADRPSQFNPALLKVLYKIPFDVQLRNSTNLIFHAHKDKLSFELARGLFRKLYRGIGQLTLGGKFLNLFEFDLQQFFMANRYSELITQMPSLNNDYENKLFLHHNMGIVMAGMIDLMSLPSFEMSELGAVRKVLALGQRAGRISNVVSTREREFAEGDFTGELVGNNTSLAVYEVLTEHSDILKQIYNMPSIKCFNVKKYSRGLEDLHQLHIRLKEVI